MIYFIWVKGTEIFKIGQAKDPKKRLDAIQANNHCDLVLYAVLSGGRLEENALHRKFCQNKVHGEWFKIPRKVVDKFLDSCTSGDRHWIDNPLYIRLCSVISYEMKTN